MPEPRNQSYIDGTGALVTVPDLYGNVTSVDVDRASDIEKLLYDALSRIEVEYIKIGSYLILFEEEKLYLAKGLPDFKSWLVGDIKMSYRLAHDLMRIVREALPALAEQNAMDAIPNVSTMRALLPVLEDGNEKFAQLAKDVQGLTIHDVYAKIKEVRGKPQTFSTITAFVKQRDSIFHVRFVNITDVETFTLGTLEMNKEQWRLFNRVYHGTIEYV